MPDRPPGKPSLIPPHGGYRRLVTYRLGTLFELAGLRVVAL